MGSLVRFAEDMTKKRASALWCVCLLPLGGCGIAAAGQRHSVVHIDFRRNQAEINPNDWTLALGGRHFACVRKGEPSTPPAVVSDPEVGRAIRIQLDPTTGRGPDNGRDKINYTVIKGSREQAPAFDGQTVYFSFALKLDPNEFETPTSGRDYVVAQWWQGAPFGPPLSLQIETSDSPSANPRIVFAIHNRDTGANPSARAILLHPSRIKELERGKWYKFVVGTRFGYAGDGELTVWINNDRATEVAWHGSLGYDPAASAADLGFKTGRIDRRPNRGLELYFGPYRDRMPRRQVFYYAEISYGDEKPSARLGA